MLRRVLQEKIDANLERIFRILGLKYSQKDIYGAYLGMMSHRKELRASAIELLDNVLKKDVKKYLFPIVDSITVESKIQRGQAVFGLRIKNLEDALEYLIRGSDPWLKTCALFKLRGTSSARLRDLARESLMDPDPTVRETAKLVLVANDA